MLNNGEEHCFYAYLSSGHSTELGLFGQDAVLEARRAYCTASLQSSGDGLVDGSRLYAAAGRQDDVLPL